MSKLGNEYCVYGHKLNDVFFYIGIGNSKRPYSKHHRSEFWWNIYRKNKHNVKIEIIKTGLDWSYAQLIEIDLIKKYGRRDLGTGILVNLTSGGDGQTGAKWTEERKMLVSEKSKGINNPFFGKKHSEESNIKNRLAKLGIKQSKESIEKRAISLTGKNRPKEVRMKISETNKKAHSLTRIPPPKRTNKKKGRSNLSVQDVIDIRNMAESFSYREIAAKYKKACSAISKIVNKQSFQYI